jgi:K+-sensing histidine kinase KdpD
LVNDGDRPNPDALLSSLQREEAAKKRGRLKAFPRHVAGRRQDLAMLEVVQAQSEKTWSLPANFTRICHPCFKL